MNSQPSASVVKRVAAYEPQHVDAQSWAAQSVAVREAALLAASTLPRVNSLLPALASFGSWLLAEGYHVDLEAFANVDLIERFVQIGMAAKTAGTRATRRSILRRAAARIRPNALGAPEAIAYRRARAPYTSAEIASLFASARTQPTPGRRWSLTAILALGLGCGLRGQDLAWVRGIDVACGTDAVVVSVAGGPRPRTVPPLDAYAEVVATCARRAGESLLIGGETPGRRNVTNPALERVLSDRSAPRVLPSRLRSTWLVTHLNLRTPLPLLLRAAGLASSRTLDDLLEYAEPVRTYEAVQLLRGAAPDIASAAP